MKFGSPAGGMTIQSGTVAIDDSGGPITIEPAAGATFTVDQAGTVTITGTVTAELAAGSKVDVGSITGTVTIAPEAGSTIDVGNVGGSVTVTPEAGATFVVDASGTVEVSSITGTVVITPEAGSTFDVNASGTVDVGAISGTVTVTPEAGSTFVVDASGTVEVSSITGTVVIAPEAGSSFDVSSISGTVTVAPEAGSTFEVNAGTVQVENVAGDFLVVGDLPSQTITFTGNGTTQVTTTTNVLPGMKALVISGSQSDTGSISIVNVVGATSGKRYAWQAVLGVYRPLIVPIDPGADLTYQIKVGAGATGTTALVYVTSIQALAQPPQLPPASVLVESFLQQSYSGNGAVSVPLPGWVMLKRVDWRMALVSTVSGYQIMHIQYVPWGQSGIIYADVDAGLGMPGNVSVGAVDLAGEDSDGLPTNFLQVVGNSSSTAISAFKLTVTYELL